jgi:hypothetical protein
MTMITNSSSVPVLMLDTFEQMTALEDWAREVAQQLPANVLLVIAGRALPNWDRAWPGWMANAQVEELKPMSEDDMRGGSSRVDLQACKLGTGRRFTTS